MANKGRATATYVVTEEVVEGELQIAIVVPATVEESAINTYTVNGSVALGKAIAAAGVQFATVPTKAEAKRASQLARLVASGKTEAEAQDIYELIFG